ncbi:MAG: hypothetical protein ACRCZE_02775 [Candidatus Altimarinota bacterium]
MNRSSSFLAITSILAILLVASIAINNVEESSLRKPFPASAEAGEIGKVSVFDSLKEEEGENSGDEAEEELIFTQEEIDYFDSNFEGLEDVAMENSGGQEVDTEDQGEVELVVEEEEAFPVQSGEAINAELLRRVGFSNFILQKKPFEKKIFDEFDFAEFSSIEVGYYQVKERVFGNEKEILQVFHFAAADAAMTGEIYNLLKAGFTSELGVTINETNSFGLASFYINFEEPRASMSGKVFLVVKLKEGVYALSYPRGSVNLPEGDKYFQSVKNLLDELLQQQ